MVNAIVYLYPMNEGVSHTLERLSITITESVESLCRDSVDEQKAKAKAINLGHKQAKSLLKHSCSHRLS